VRSEVFIDGMPVSMRPATGFAADLAQAQLTQSPVSTGQDTATVVARPDAVSALLPGQPAAEPSRHEARSLSLRSTCDIGTGPSRCRSLFVQIRPLPAM